MLYVVLILAGVGIGILTTMLFYRKKNRRSISSGVLRVDRSDDEPYLFLELSKGAINKIVSMKQVTFDVKVENYLSQK